MRPILRQLLWFGATLTLLAACGQGSTTTSGPLNRPAVVTPPAVPASATITTTQDLLAGIPQSQTPQGYHILGQLNAPVTLVNYSDFL